MIYLKRLFITVLLLAAVYVQAASNAPVVSPEAPATKVDDFVEITRPDMTLTNSRVFVVDIHGPIDKRQLYLVRRSIQEAKDAQVGLVVFDMNTPGGRVDITREIVNAILELGESIPTATYVNKEAYSAGAIISVATHRIYMAPSSVIGAAAVISGDGKELSETVEEKFTSATYAFVRASCQKTGHDPRVIEAMMRKDSEYVITGDMIAKEGEILTLTDQEASRMVGPKNSQRHLLSHGTHDSLEDVAKTLGIEEPEVMRHAATTADKIAESINLFAYILLAGGMFMVYMESQTPTFGIMGILGVALLGVWFWSMTSAGLANPLEILIFFLGVILLAIEMFVLPGFGIAGIAGVLMMTGAVIFAMVPHLPDFPVDAIPANNFFHALRPALSAFSYAVIILLGAAMIVGRYIQHFGGTAPSTTTLSSGHLTNDQAAALVGSRGTAQSPLKPSGLALINDRIYDVTTESEFVEAGEMVEVKAVHTPMIVVAPVNRTAS